MRRFLVLAAAVPLFAVPPAEAAAHELTAFCVATAPAPAGHGWMSGAARAADHSRPVSTTVWCTSSTSPTETSYRQSLPGAVAAVAGPLATDYKWQRVCVTAWAYWSDGHALGPVTHCGYNATDVSIAGPR